MALNASNHMISLEGTGSALNFEHYDISSILVIALCTAIEMIGLSASLVKLLLATQAFGSLEMCSFWLPFVVFGSRF